MGKVSTYGIIGTCLAAASIVLILIAMFSNGWYTVTYVNEYDEKIEFDFGLTEVEMTYSNPLGGSSSETVDLDNEPEDVGSLTNIFLIISLVLILAYIVLGIIGSLRIISGFIASIVGFAAAGCLLFVVIYFPVAFPDAFEEAGSVDEFIDAMSLGWAYYLVMGAIVPLVIGAIMLLGVRTPLKYLLALPDTGRKFPDEGNARRHPPHRVEDRYDGRHERRQHQYPRDEHFHDRDRRDYPPRRRDDDYTEHDRWDQPPRRRDDDYTEYDRRDLPAGRRGDHYNDRDDDYYHESFRVDQPPRQRDDHYNDRDETDDLSILKKRLARGEITKQEFEELRSVIEE